jgi:hypothetical protein
MASVCVELKPDSDGEARRDGRWLLKREDRRVVFSKLRVNRPAADWIAVKCGIYGESGLLKVCFGTLYFQSTKATRRGFDTHLDVTERKVAIAGTAGATEDKAIIGEGFNAHAT